MSKEVRRGYYPEDENFFATEQLKRLQKAAGEIRFLLDQGYPAKSSSAFVGNHYMFSERQRLALVRAVSSEKDIASRKDRLLEEYKNITCVHIDGFNTIITLEVALSGSPVFYGMDGSIRDLAGLRGTYRIIDKTEQAVPLMYGWLDEKGIKEAVIYLDEPVSNSGRLKVYLLEAAKGYHVDINVDVRTDVDRTLEIKGAVITSDAIILNRCGSWINMNRELIEKKMDKVWSIKLFA